MPPGVRHYQNVANCSVERRLSPASAAAQITGGKSTGPKTEQGRKRCAAAKTKHGNETRAAREYRAEKFRELKYLFDQMYSGKLN